MTSQPKKRVLSGMQPSGLMHLGNYLGALQNWKQLQAEHECYFFVADWHALSTNYADTSRIREYVRELLIDWLAAGIDPNRSVVFIQSRVPEHAILHLLFSMMIPVSWLERNPTYKEKQEEIKEKDLSTYGFLGLSGPPSRRHPPVQTGFRSGRKRSTPHLELTREVARRFNDIYKAAVFPEPKEHLTKFPKVPGTDGRKMSKSYDNTINLSDSEPVVRQKLKTMVTDPARVRRMDPGNPDLCPVYEFHKMYLAASHHRADQPRMPYRRNRLHRLQETRGGSSGRHTGADLGGRGRPWSATLRTSRRSWRKAAGRPAPWQRPRSTKRPRP